MNFSKKKKDIKRQLESIEREYVSASTNIRRTRDVPSTYQAIRFHWQGLDGRIDITRLRKRIPWLGKKAIEPKKQNKRPG